MAKGLSRAAQAALAKGSGTADTGGPPDPKASAKPVKVFPVDAELGETVETTAGKVGIIVDKELFTRMMYSVIRGHGDLFSRNSGHARFGDMLGYPGGLAGSEKIRELEALIQ